MKNPERCTVYELRWLGKKLRMKHPTSMKKAELLEELRLRLPDIIDLSAGKDDKAGDIFVKTATDAADNFLREIIVDCVVYILQMNMASGDKRRLLTSLMAALRIADKKTDDNIFARHIEKIIAGLAE